MSRINLIERIEAIALRIIEQISTGQSPQISYSSGRNITAESSLREESVSSGCSSDLQQDTMSYNSLFDLETEQSK